MTPAIAERTGSVRLDAAQGKHGFQVVPILGVSLDQPEYRLLDGGTLRAVNITEISSAGSVPELKVENFSQKVHEARTARQKAGTPLSKMTINEIISQIDQYYKDNPGKRDVSVMRVIWDVGIKPHVKSNIAGRPLK